MTDSIEYFDQLDVNEHIAELEARSIIQTALRASELEPIAEFATGSNQINSEVYN